MKHTKSSIKELLRTNDNAVKRALVVLYDRQTRDEKLADATRHHNNRGFNHGDAKALGYWARLVIAKRELYPNTLAQARRRLMKYAGQLAVIANEKAKNS
jgi:hypothetical protein